MLTSEERQEIEAEMGHHAQRQAMAIEAMKIVQRHRGWISDQDLRDIGELLDVSPADLDGVSTFYNLIFRQPVGRHVILICDSVSCWIMGHDGMLDQLRSRLGIGLGETTSDGRFTLLPVACLGTCDHAPALMVDDELCGDLTAERIGEVLEKYP